MRRMERHGMRYDVLLMNFCNITNTKDTISCVFILTNSLNKNNYLNFAKTKPSSRQSRVSERRRWVKSRGELSKEARRFRVLRHTLDETSRTIIRAASLLLLPGVHARSIDQLFWLGS